MLVDQHIQEQRILLRPEGAGEGGAVGGAAAGAGDLAVEKEVTVFGRGEAMPIQIFKILGTVGGVKKHGRAPQGYMEEVLSKAVSKPTK